MRSSFRAPNHCRTAHKITISGARIAQNMSTIRRKVIFHHGSSGSAMLGWTETQEQAKIVARQLQRISQIERWSGHVHWSTEEEPDGIVSLWKKENGAASVKPWKRYSTVKMSSIQWLVLKQLLPIRLRPCLEAFDSWHGSRAGTRPPLLLTWPSNIIIILLI